MLPHLGSFVVCDLTGKSDPYVVLEMNGLTAQSKVISKTLNPGTDSVGLLNDNEREQAGDSGGM